MTLIKYFFSFFSLLLSFILFFSPLYAAQNIATITPSNNYSIVPEKQIISVGILSYNPLATLKGSRWNQSFERLNKHPDYFFVPFFLGAEELEKELQQDKLDFIICDAFSYLKLKKEYGIHHFLTRNELYSSKSFSLEGLSIYTKNNNYNIVRFLDLKDKKIGILEGDSPLSRTLLKNFLFKQGLIIDYNIHIQTMDSLEQLLEALEAKEIDSIITKSGIIEKNQYRLNNVSMLRLLNPRQNWQAPFLHSSELIPEWPIARAWFIENELTNQVTSLLIDNYLFSDLVDENNFQTDHSESDEDFLQQFHWSIAQDYNILHQLFSLTKNPQEAHDSDGHSHISHEGQTIVVISIIFILLIIVSLFLHSSRDLNNRLTLSKKSLENEIKEKQLAQEQALSHQDELAHVSRLSTMGEMASGLAHELNQPLSAINTYVQGCIRRINMGHDNPEEIINALQLTSQQADRAAGIIRRLRSFVRKGQVHKTYSEINKIIMEVTSFLENQFKDKDIDIKYQLGEKLEPVLIDIIQIEQVLVNLLKNAVESMHDISEPSLIVTSKKLNDNSLKTEVIEVCVIDNGHGIGKDKLKRIFNPFFTTKNSGMGMGLSISHSIIESHNGRLYATNNTIQGAKFCLTLPLTKDPFQENKDE